MAGFRTISPRAHHGGFQALQSHIVGSFLGRRRFLHFFLPFVLCDRRVVEDRHVVLVHVVCEGAVLCGYRALVQALLESRAASVTHCGRALRVPALPPPSRQRVTRRSVGDRVAGAGAEYLVRVSLRDSSLTTPGGSGCERL